MTDEWTTAPVVHRLVQSPLGASTGKPRTPSHISVFEATGEQHGNGESIVGCGGDVLVACHPTMS